MSRSRVTGSAHRRTLAGIIALTTLVTPATQSLLTTVAHAEDVPVEVGASTSPLPFDLPSTAALRSSPKLVFAHYFTPLPMSLDNQDPATDYYQRNYLTPGGERGKHAAYGGYLRDRPLTRPVSSDPAWRLADMKTEVRQAIAAGIDGFTLDILQIEGDRDFQVWENAKLMMRAAQLVDPAFKVMIYLDLTGGMSSKTPEALAAAVALLGSFPSAYRVGDDHRLVVGAVDAEAHDATWWKSFLQVMDDRYGEEVAFLPTFIAHEENYASSFAPISWGMSIWGSRNPAWSDPSLTYATSPRGRAEKIKSLGVKWMQPVSVQDERPNQGIFDEANNTENLRDTWELARATNADFVQIPTWNDYGEGTHLAPSTMHGWTYMDLTSYYLAWYKTGVAPKIVRDAVTVTHRKQLLAAQPSYPQTTLMRWRGGSPARDTVEALTFLTSPGNVVVSVGSKRYLCAVDAGVDTCTVPLSPGTVSAVVSHDGVPSAGVRSPYPVTATPGVQDFQYVGASSGRYPAGPDVIAGGLPEDVSTVDRVVTLTANADGYANAGAPGTTYGTTSTLSTRGNVAAASYVHFPAPTVPSGTVLTGAKLRLRTPSDLTSASVDTQVVSLVAGGVDERGLTWRTRPAVGAAVGRIAGTLPSRTYDVDLDPSVVARLSAGDSLALTSAGLDEARFWSKDYEGATSRPQLVLTYSPVVPPLAPGTPTAVSAVVDGPSVQLRWAAPQQGTPVAVYELYRVQPAGASDVDQDASDGSPAVSSVESSSAVATVPPTTTTATHVPGPGTWSYRVVAVDARGRRSPATAAVTVVVADHQAPTAPVLTAGSVSVATSSLSWSPAQDDVAVTGYDVYRGAVGSALEAKVLAGSTSGTSFSEPGLPVGTWEYQVVAEDAAGNRSSAAGPLSVRVAPQVTIVTTRSLLPTADTYANAGTPASTFGRSSSLATRADVPSEAFLRFAVPSAAPGQVLTGARLQFRTKDDSTAGSRTAQSVALVEGGWDENTVSWTSRPAATGTVLGTLAEAPQPSTVYSVPLTTSAVAERAGSSVDLSLTAAGADSLWFWSSNYATLGARPQLVLTWSWTGDAPEAPVLRRTAG